MSDGEGSIVARVREAVAEDRVSLPPLPELATRLQQMLGDESADATGVAELVQSDPAVAASLLRYANSAAFGGLREISDLKQAIARLGMQRVASLVTTMLLQGHFGSSSRQKKRLLQVLWDHAILCATTARRLAQQAGLDAEECYLAGLLHDIGRPLVLKAVDQLQSEDTSLDVTDSVLSEVIEMLHGELGHRALTDWKMPATICQVALGEESADGSEVTLNTLVQASDAISSKLGHHPSPDPELNLLEEPAIDQLGLGDIELAELMVDLEDEFEKLKGMIRS